MIDLTYEERIRREADNLRTHWSSSPRWEGIERPFEAEDVIRLRGSITVEHTLARLGAERLWWLMTTKDHVPALGALTGGQAVEMVKAGLQAIYVSGWQVAADANLAGQTYPDQSLYPANSVPAVVRRINNALQRADQIAWSDGDTGTSWMAPVVADAEAGFGGALNAFELMKALIESGAAGVHFEDQLASEKKCGHLGGKVLVPTSQFVRTLAAARLAADVLGVPTVLVARTDAESATLLTSDVDEADRPFIEGDRTAEGFFRIRGGVEAAIARGLAYAPFADVLWCETSTPDLEDARVFAEAIHERFPGKLLAYNCSPSFNWRAHLDDDEIAGFQRELGAMGYRFQFITLAGFHALNASMFELANAYANEGMSAYVRLQEREFELEPLGYSATRHQAEVGTGYFDRVSEVVSRGTASTLALAGSTERAQFAASERQRETGASRRARPRPRLSADRRLRRGSAAPSPAAAPVPATAPASGVRAAGSGRGAVRASGAAPGSARAAGRGRGSRNGSSLLHVLWQVLRLLRRVARLLHRVGGLLAVPRLDGQAIGVGGRERRTSDLVAAREQEDLVAVAGLPELRPVRLAVLVHDVREDALAAHRAALPVVAFLHAETRTQTAASGTTGR